MEQDIKPAQRDERGLIIGFPYKFKGVNEVDWRAIVPPEYLYLNPQKRSAIEKKYGKRMEEIDLATTKVDDRDLVITLAGLRFLLKLRGYNSLRVNPINVSDSYACVSCDIDFIPNCETDFRPIHHSDSASAHHGNTKSFGQNYLVEIATNRAVCRTIRAFLNIDIVSREELGTEDSGSDSNNLGGSSDMLLPILREKMEKYGYTVDQIKARAALTAPEEARKWNKLEDLSPKWIVWCLERIDQKAKSNSKT